MSAPYSTASSSQDLRFISEGESEVTMTTPELKLQHPTNTALSKLTLNEGVTLVPDIDLQIQSGLKIAGGLPKIQMEPSFNIAKDLVGNGVTVFNGSGNIEINTSQARNDVVRFQDDEAGGETMRITKKPDSSTVGMVGINNVSPSEALDVSGNIQVSGNISASGTISGSIIALQAVGTEALEVTGNINASGNIDATGSLMGSGVEITSAYPIVDFKDGTPAGEDMESRIVGAGGLLVFETGGNGAIASSERLRITTDGKVGVGTDVPAEALDVSGNIKASGTIDARELSAYAGDGNATRFFAAEYVGEAVHFGIWDASADGGAGRNVIRGQANGNFHTFGKVGVGQEVDTEALEVNGNIKASGNIRAPSFTVGTDHAIWSFTGDVIGDKTDRALLIGFGGNTDRVGIGEALYGKATFEVYDHSNHSTPNKVVVNGANMEVAGSISATGTISGSSLAVESLTMPIATTIPVGTIGQMLYMNEDQYYDAGDPVPYPKGLYVKTDLGWQRVQLDAVHTP